MFQKLSAQERVIARQVAQGRSNKQVAKALKITEGTVKCHMHAIFAKTRLRSRFELIRAFEEVT